MQTISVAGMRAAEHAAAAAGLPEETMMEHAGRNAARIIEAEFRRRPGCRRVVIITGKGNNAGDGLVAAAALLPLPVLVAAAVPLTGLKGAAAHHAAAMPAAVPVVPADQVDLRPGDLLVDALLGTGITGAVREPLAGLIRRINDSRLPVIALDLPSGTDGDTGSGDPAVRADLTITFGAPKHGLTACGAALTGPIRLAGIGVPPSAFNGDGPDLFMEDDAARLLDRLPFDTHKNRRGRVLTIAGSSQYPGAAALNVMGSLRAGAGYVRLAFPGDMPLPLPAAVVRHNIPAAAGAFGADSLPSLLALLPAADAVTLGSGWGQHPGLTAVLDALLNHAPGGVIDADALRKLPETARRPGGNWILTPHPGEAAALLDAIGGERPASRIGIACRLAQHFQTVTILKGPQSVTAAPDGRYSLNASGSPALAVAGSGDVLAGTAAAFLAAGMTAFDAARLAVYLHGRAGETVPQRGLIADDLPDRIRAAMAEIAPVC